ncbi:MAG: ferrous iron transport protein [Bacillota bacterium]|nr:ferrous iron transport protein [Bacillota bacterium]
MQRPVPSGEETTLASLSPGESGEITTLEATGALRRHLLDLGLVPGTRIEVLFKSPLGDPVAYKARGAAIALRVAVARQIKVRRVG